MTSPQPSVCPRGCQTPAECLEKFTGRKYDNCQLRVTDARPWPRGAEHIAAAAISEMKGEGITSGQSRLEATAILAELHQAGYRIEDGRE